MGIKKNGVQAKTNFKYKNEIIEKIVDFYHPKYMQ